MSLSKQAVERSPKNWVGLVRVNRKREAGLSTFQGVIRLEQIPRQNSSLPPDRKPNQLNNLASNSSPCASPGRWMITLWTDWVPKGLCNCTFVLTWLTSHNYSTDSSKVGVRLGRNSTYDYMNIFSLPWKCACIQNPAPCHRVFLWMYVDLSLPLFFFFLIPLSDLKRIEGWSCFRLSLKITENVGWDTDRLSFGDKIRRRRNRCRKSSGRAGS